MILLLPQWLESLKDLPSPGVAVLLQRQSRDVKAGRWEEGKAHQCMLHWARQRSRTA